MTVKDRKSLLITQQRLLELEGKVNSLIDEIVDMKKSFVNVISLFKKAKIKTEKNPAI